MINMDMVGRMRNNQVSVLGADSADEWKALVEPACAKRGSGAAVSGDGFGPSDHTPFYAAGVPVLHFFTGSHADYHKPSDTADKINAAGAAQVAQVAADLALAVDVHEAKLTLRKVPAPAPQGDMRSFNASLGTIPDYAGPEGGKKGVLLGGVRPGGAAEKGGLRRGDLLVRLGHSRGDERRRPDVRAQRVEAGRDGHCGGAARRQRDEARRHVPREPAPQVTTGPRAQRGGSPTSREGRAHAGRAILGSHSRPSLMLGLARGQRVATQPPAAC